MARVLTHNEARKFYDRFGRRQDTQRFYEDAALKHLIERARFEDAQSVFEFGCGTGSLAEILLDDHMPANARYVAQDVSSTMVELTRERLGSTRRLYHSLDPAFVQIDKMKLAC